MAESFKLIIEYKVDSPEGADQVSRYLRTFKVSSEADGILVYLTPVGNWPPSISADDPRVHAMSFDQLISCIDEGLRTGAELDKRGVIFAEEFRNCLKRVVNRRITVDKPIISESTKLLSKHHERFNRLRNSAKQEAAEFIEYLVELISKEMRPIMGPEMILSSHGGWGYYVFRKPSWSAHGVEFGIAFGLEGKVGERVMHEYAHSVSVRVQPIKSGSRISEQRELTRSLSKVIGSALGEEPDGSNQWFAFWQDVPLKPEDDWDAWATQVVGKMTRLGRELTPHLDRFAKRAMKP